MTHEQSVVVSIFIDLLIASFFLLSLQDLKNIVDLTIKNITTAFGKNDLSKTRLKAIATTATRVAEAKLTAMVNSCKRFSVSQQRQINRSFLESIQIKMQEGYRSARDTEVRFTALFEHIKGTHTQRCDMSVNNVGEFPCIVFCLPIVLFR